ncbi:spore germination protein GerPB [Bacillus xiapuensis]|uniref:spore germination protein GerPB n=1 Tax=Bacillus xiapuensis TaxID=2014075 RepID=UPI000C235FB3|nr:spore germination protein GerPB [Bacillus xiapuensis]
MNIFLSQTINIRLLNIESIANSSMLQIGTSGHIEQSSYLFNTGAFTTQAPEATGETIVTSGAQPSPFLIPLQPPS